MDIKRKLSSCSFQAHSDGLSKDLFRFFVRTLANSSSTQKQFAEIAARNKDIGVSNGFFVMVVCLLNLGLQGLLWLLGTATKTVHVINISPNKAYRM